MKPRNSDYPIGKLLIECIAHAGLSSEGFFKALGYANVSKAVQSLDEWLVQGDGNQELIKLLQSSRFAVPEAQLTSVLAKNQIMLEGRQRKEALAAEEQARARFVPQFYGRP